VLAQPQEQLEIESLINKRYTCSKNESIDTGLPHELCVAFSRFYEEHLVFQHYEY